MACACACEHACNKGCSINSVSLMSIIAGHTSEVLMAIRSTQQNQSINNNNTATTTSSVCLMNRGVRVGAASITDEPEKTPAMIKLDLLSYYLLIHTTYDLSNPSFQPIVMPTRNAHFFGPGSPNPQILVRIVGRSNPAKVVRQSGAVLRHSAARGARLFGN